MTIPDLAVWAVEVTERREEEMDKFTLTIELGNDAMSAPQDVAAALEAIAARLEAIPGDGGGWADEEGRIRDENGNSVGEWRIEWDEGPPERHPHVAKLTR